ncbi:hypothetical protein NLI96_g11133 [Meripilus lineatus]|uniref:Alginate lyase domain-containing protein n=1 Tax=Meripilus lineatus TaxID=2056292 RepID=A0AAD5UUQ9_9APHY|nr:hypothetical protein NLI96_g11133 [Physisporinus lineatus]
MWKAAKTSTLVLLAACLSWAPAVHSFYSYDNDFIPPQYFLSKNWSNTTLEAQQTILAWAEETAAKGPWSVMNKTITPPSGTKHDYMSWAPYWWPDCSKAGNTTELTPEQSTPTLRVFHSTTDILSHLARFSHSIRLYACISGIVWVTCAYVPRDGQFNPDVRTLINDIGNFGDMSDAILYNSISWAINGDSKYPTRIANWIDTWFLNNDTMMNPNLNYAQMNRGPTGQVGTHTGILDLKSMAKIAVGILILREGKAPEWTTEVDNGFDAWIKAYIPWLTSAKIALEEMNSANNHGSFYFNQLASLQILSGDKDGAKQTIQKFFTGIYENQIAANGDQPFESERTHPYHYRAYNLQAMLTNARLGAYVGFNAWNVTTKQGGTIKSALDFAMTKAAGSEPASEIYMIVQAIAASYGDPGNTYANWLLQNAGPDYVKDACFLWNQPLSDNGLVNVTSLTSSASAAGAAATGKNQKANDASAVQRYGVLVYTLCVAAGLFVLRGL